MADRHFDFSSLPRELVSFDVIDREGGEWTLWLWDVQAQWFERPALTADGLTYWITWVGLPRDEQITYASGTAAYKANRTVSHRADGRRDRPNPEASNGHAFWFGIDYRVRRGRPFVGDSVATIAAHSEVLADALLAAETADARG